MKRNDSTLWVTLCITAAGILMMPLASAFSGTGSGTEADPYVITTVQQLQEMQDGLAAHYVLGNDIDASETATWNGGAGFHPIGYDTNPEEVGQQGGRFSGSLDGNGHLISNLNIERPDEEYVGLFGFIDDGKVYDLGLSVVKIHGQAIVGALAGQVADAGSLLRCFSTGGTVSCSALYAGGLAGMGIGDGTAFTDCFSCCSVSGGACGGLIGKKWNGLVTRCYFAGSLTGDWCKGAITSEIAGSDARATSCFWDVSTSGEDGFGCVWGEEYTPALLDGRGLSTAQMRQRATFESAGWDFDYVWTIDEGNGYPTFLWAKTDHCGSCTCYETTFAEQWESLLARLGETDESFDWDGDGLPERYALQLAAYALCHDGDARHTAAAAAYEANLLAIDAESGDHADLREVLAALAMVSDDLRTLIIAEFGLTGTYTVMPDTGKAPDEPLSGEGDYDGDGVSNQQEYANVYAQGYDMERFVAAATNPLQTGAEHMPASGALGLVLLGLLIAGVASARLRHCRQ